MSDLVYSYRGSDGGGEAGYSAFDLEVRLEQKRPLDDTDHRIIDKHAEQLRKELQARTTAADPGNVAWKASWLAEVRARFAAAGMAAIYLQEIPNEYCGPLCCPHRVWLLVTTEIGVFKLGWRKRVISLDWSRTIVQAWAVDLFPSEDVTRGDLDIHCWGYEKLGEYLRTIRGARP